MRNSETLYIHFVSLNELKERVGFVLEKKQAFKNQKQIVEFGDMTGYNRFMSFNKEVILGEIYNNAPESIYKLANNINRNYASVHRDCQALEAMGFIKLIETDTNRGQVRPTLSFNYSSIQVEGTFVTIELAKNSRNKTA